MARQVLYAAATAAVLTVLGLPLGWLWQAISPRVQYVVVKPTLFPVNGETVQPIGTDARFALLGLGVGLVTGLAAYLLAGRLGSLAMLIGLAAGASAGSVLAWLPHHLSVDHLIHAKANGASVTIHPDLGATGTIVAWPLVAVIVFALLESLDLSRRHALVGPGLPSGDLGEHGPGEGHEVGGGQFDLQAAPPGGDIEGRQP